MSNDRLPAAVEAAALVRRAQADGNFAAVIKKGDPDRGAMLLLVSSRGRHIACLERTLSLSGSYSWERIGPGESASSADIRELLARRTRFDADFWAIELDIADSERFIAETIAVG